MKDVQKRPKLGWSVVVRGHPRSSEMSPFDRAHTTSYSTLIETMRLSCTVFEIQLVICRNSPTLPYIPLLHLASPLGVTPFEFRKDFWRQKTRVPGLSRGFVCVILSVAVLIQYRLVTDRQTDTQTDGHTTTATITATIQYLPILRMASRGKKCVGRL